MLQITNNNKKKTRRKKIKTEFNSGLNIYIPENSY